MTNYLDVLRIHVAILWNCISTVRYYLSKFETVTHDAEAHLYLRTICCFYNGVLALELSGERARSGKCVSAFLASRVSCVKRSISTTKDDYV
jgi:hypothetical protein